MTKISRIYIYDVLRVIALFGVLNIHILGIFAAGNFQPDYLKIIAIYSDFAVPLFVLISGALFYEKYKDKNDLGDYYQSKIRKILIPYIVVSIFYISYQIIARPILGTDSIINYYILYLVKGNSVPHLYFVPMIMTLYFLYPLILRFYKKNKYITILSSIFISYFSVYCIDLLGIVKSNYRWFFMPWLLYAVVGFLYAEKRQFLAKKNNIVLSVILVFAFYIFMLIVNTRFTDFKYVPVLLALAAIISVTDVILPFLKSKLPKVIIFLSNYSYKIYLLHYAFIILAAELLMSKKIPYSIEWVIIMYPVIIIGSILIYKGVELAISVVKDKILAISAIK